MYTGQSTARTSVYQSPSLLVGCPPSDPSSAAIGVVYSSPAVYGAVAAAAAAAAATQRCAPFAVDSVAFCPSIQSGRDELERCRAAAAAAALQSHNCVQSTPSSAGVTWPFNPSNIGLYPCSPAAYVGLDPRRKNATRESTGTLKAWLYEHIKNPYPTKGEKIMLAIITKMTLTQVSTWFANARRRLKKENKMQWSTTHGEVDTRKPRDVDDIEDDVSDYNDVSDYDVQSAEDASERRQMSLANQHSLVSDNSRVMDLNKTVTLHESLTAAGVGGEGGSGAVTSPHQYHHHHHQSADTHLHQLSSRLATTAAAEPKSAAGLRSTLVVDSRSAFCCVQRASRDDTPEMNTGDVSTGEMRCPSTSTYSAVKPRIWSLADVAMSPDHGHTRPVSETALCRFSDSMLVDTGRQSAAAAAAGSRV